MRGQVAMERLKAKEDADKTSASAQEGAAIGDAAREPERVEVALGAARLVESRSGGLESGLTKGTLEVVEADKVGTFARDVGQACVEETKEEVETPQDVGKEEEQPKLQTEQEEP
jgi:hypothetical protein